MADNENEHPRYCDNWLADFLRWTLPRNEARESYTFWTGLYTIACVLRRHVKISKEYLGSWETYPYMYLMFVGPAGNRKTTTVNYNVELLDEIPGLVGCPDQVTVPKLASSLAEAEECAMYINAGEMSEFIIKSGLDMYSFLTKAFDGVRKLSVGTHMRGIELAEKPCINFLAATTQEWFNDNIPQSILDGGFGRRCLIIYEDDVRRRKMMYKDVNVKGLYDDYHLPLLADLKFIGKNLFGDFQLTPEAVNKFEQWYQDGSGVNRQGAPKNPKMRGYYETKPAYAMKLAMILKIADRDIINRDQLILSWQNLEEAIKTIEGLEQNMSEVLGGTGRNVYKFDVREIYNFIKEKQPIDLTEIKRTFMNVAEPLKLDELINGLRTAGLIVVDDANGKVSVKKII